MANHGPRGQLFQSHSHCSHCRQPAPEAFITRCQAPGGPRGHSARIPAGTRAHPGSKGRAACRHILSYEQQCPRTASLGWVVVIWDLKANIASKMGAAWGRLSCPSSGPFLRAAWGQQGHQHHTAQGLLDLVRKIKLAPFIVLDPSDPCFTQEYDLPQAPGSPGTRRTKSPLGQLCCNPGTLR